MINQFKNNILLADTNFNRVFNNQIDNIKFICMVSNDLQVAWNTLGPKNQEVLNTAVEALINNAKITQTRKMQQMHFAEVMQLLMGDSQTLVNALTSSASFQIKLLQLIVIFLIRTDIDQQDHHHDVLRASITNALKEVQSHFNKEDLCQKNLNY